MCLLAVCLLSIGRRMVSGETGNSAGFARLIVAKLNARLDAGESLDKIVPLRQKCVITDAICASQKIADIDKWQSRRLKEIFENRPLLSISSWSTDNPEMAITAIITM